ncbi:MAG: Yip1 family protein [Chitinophagaceae bacterium]
MTLIDRAKNMIVAPVREWDQIAGETPDTGKIITGYVLPLAGAAAVAAFIGYGLIGQSTVFGIRVASTDVGLYYAIRVLIGAIAGVFIAAAVIDALAPSFGSEKNMGKSIQLVAYSFTPAWLGGLLSIFPPLALIGALAGIYALYLLYVGLPKLKKTPADKQVGYFVVSLIVMIVVNFLIFYLVERLLGPSLLTYGLGDYRVG